MKKNAFTLIEVIATLIIIALIALISVPIVYNIIDNSEKKSYQRDVDNYAHAIELALSKYELDSGDYPNSLDDINVEYTGSKVKCNVKKLRKSGEIFLTECYVNKNKVKSKKTDSGWYEYGKNDKTIVDLYGANLEKDIKNYIHKNNNVPSNINDFENTYSNDVECNYSIYEDGSIYLSQCKVDGIDVLDNNSYDNSYHYGKISLNDMILQKRNDSTINNYESGNKNEMYTFSHELTEQLTELTDYRYIGRVPNNYVKFNNELWRIIGVFPTEDSTGRINLRVKIKKNSLMGSSRWDLNNTNDWAISTLNTYLNGDYYNSLSGEARLMVDPVKYYLGVISSVSLSGEEFYKLERNSRIDGKGSSNTIENVGLIYPSDYIYTYALGVDNNCYINGSKCSSRDKTGSPNQGWMYSSSSYPYWTISPSTNNIYAVVFGGDYYSGSGKVSSTTVSSSRQFYPVVYLNPNVKCLKGDGSSGNPYVLSMQ